MNILKITILLTNGTDEIYLTSDLPCGIWPYTGNQKFKTEVIPNSGINYVKDNFPGIEYEVKNIRV